ncbi:hypothetical protein EG346_15780 [Chryseobacterium carnipullorum]|uniref:Uncharacterized protein n=1 Tax=Chryseobacterium carnipullorum TaxID=1124835 RepID=A0A3G6NHM7_CHRCU|nr:hypothetical protein [Chryseobacterium carnipullorum]AZA49546.1 hypothetical protein EG346_15780 [Chryseobacterium carnipullorum]AZA64443.1 hypothetical protein EG345_06795 [Chryseobacterium carnipullorum]
MITKKVTIKLDERGTIQQIREIESEDELYAFSRKLRMYFEAGFIIISHDVREAMNDKLDKIYRNFQ